MPKYKQDAKVFEIRLVETPRSSKTSPGFRYQMNFPLPLVEAVKRSPTKKFRLHTLLEQEEDGTLKVKFERKTYEDPQRRLRFVLRHAIELAQSVLEQSSLRKEIAPQILALTEDPYFDAPMEGEVADELEELLYILGSMDLEPPNYISEQNIQWIIKKFQTFMQDA